MELATQTLKTAKLGYTVTDENADRLAQRINRVADLLAQTRILWVDDQPLGNRAERSYLRVVGATVVNVLTTAEALDALARDDFTLVINDMGRKESGTFVTQAGEELATRMRAQGFGQSIIGYVGVLRPLPASWFGITNKPDVLMNLVVDVVERRI
jgi:PleD family two-component response regulator